MILYGARLIERMRSVFYYPEYIRMVSCWIATIEIELYDSPRFNPPLIGACIRTRERNLWLLGTLLFQSPSHRGMHSHDGTK